MHKGAVEGGAQRREPNWRGEPSDSPPDRIGAFIKICVAAGILQLLLSPLFLVASVLASPYGSITPPLAFVQYFVGVLLAVLCGTAWLAVRQIRDRR